MCSSRCILQSLEVGSTLIYPILLMVNERTELRVLTFWRVRHLDDPIYISEVIHKSMVRECFRLK